MVQRMLAGGLIVAALSLCAGRTQAQDYAKALVDIADAADRICGIVSTHGDVTEIRGGVKAEVDSLVTKLAGVGVSIDANASKKTFDNVSQKAVADQLTDSRNCKYKVFNDLQDKLIPSEPKGSAPSRQKRSALPDGCDPPFTPDNMGPGMIPSGVNDVVVKRNTKDPCSTGGTWRKISGVWRKIAD
ncbi:hypothetical protein [Bradyrhizobium arachidis]|uniref:Uncharacterized protein n=1 Tax=Bradyrhizobium arachidis TaxID=858423 RepID=A0AAE7NQ86_9BRAD|nr:hypothetical protein [Bradyrhizobium arachidis]QOZ69122.1 hypothetical protein WN72_24480 [Bradyrhizobium arachidis]SFV00923.1 hypothetical protein SAMN05192541_109275 [Bradyrhizobium arachidis]